jgi:hypothetical protein
MLKRVNTSWINELNETLFFDEILHLSLNLSLAHDLKSTCIQVRGDM